MKKSIWIQRAAALIVATSSGAACVGFGNVGGMACPELAGGALHGNFAADAKANATMRAFVQASGDLAALAAQVEAEVTGACERMGRDLGLTRAQMGEGTRAKCAAVTARIDEILQAGAHASIKASVTPPECKVSAQAEAACSGQCSGHVDPGSIVANCEPGKLSGTCEGTCGGSCEGTCNGACSGACSAKDAAGKCVGKCQGTCRGQCSGTCHAKCTGTWRAPHCDAAVTGPSADVKCKASCKAHAEFTAQCTPPRVDIQASANTGEMAKLVATLRANLPILVRAELAYGRRIAGEIKTLVQISGELPGIVGNAGLHAAACVGASASAVANAQASLSVSVQASASVSGKAGVHGG
ncbi:MAG TPA: hypothetical protein VFX49_01700 [Chloroflexota bacterium]|nr:hypothetical protein [Chloroflexota bacterium]